MTENRWKNPVEQLGNQKLGKPAIQSDAGPSVAVGHLRKLDKWKLGKVRRRTRKGKKPGTKNSVTAKKRPHTRPFHGKTPLGLFLQRPLTGNGPISFFFAVSKTTRNGSNKSINERNMT